MNYLLNYCAHAPLRQDDMPLGMDVASVFGSWLAWASPVHAGSPSLRSLGDNQANKVHTLAIASTLCIGVC